MPDCLPAHSFWWLGVFNGVSQRSLGSSIQRPQEYFPNVRQFTSDLLYVSSWALIGCRTKVQVMEFESQCSANDGDVWTGTKVNLGFSLCSSSTLICQFRASHSFEWLLFLLGLRGLELSLVSIAGQSVCWSVCRLLVCHPKSVAAS